MAFVFKDWYEKNGAELNEKRVKRYQEDPEYREKVRNRNATARASRREAVQREAAASEEARRATPGPRWKEFTVPHPEDPSQTVAAFSIGALSAATHRSIQTLRQWEEEGVIPASDAVSAKGDRLYTVARIEQIVNKLEGEGRLTETGRQHRTIPALPRTIVFADGHTVEIEMHQIATLVQASGRTLVTLQQMESRGTLPATPFRASQRRYRLYTLAQINAVKAAFIAHPTLRTKDTQAAFRAFILAAWERDMPGIMQAHLQGEAREAQENDHDDHT